MPNLMKIRPTEPGYYFAKDPETLAWVMASVEMEKNGTLSVWWIGWDVDDELADPSFDDWVWYGPIEPPEPGGRAATRGLT